MIFVHFQPRLISARLLFLATMSVLSMSTAIAATYYVNAATGSDTWSGTKADPVSSPVADGPWLSLAKVSATALQPGDSVLLRCGQTWYESLKLTSSGTAANSINIGTYPGACSTAPLIDGAVAIPADNWTLYSGQIYRARLPVSLTGDGTFDAGITGWYNWSPSNDSVLSQGTNCAANSSSCLNFVAGTGPGNSLVVSKEFKLLPMVYQATISIKAPAGSVIRMIVRRTLSPWDSVGLNQSITGTGSWQTYSFPFRGTVALANARLDIEVPAKVAVSLDNVAVEVVVGSPRQLLADGLQMTPARHPNIGFNSVRPQSPYFLNVQDADQTLVNGAYRSTFITTGSDLQLPSGATLLPGMRVRIRTNAWTVDERNIASIAGNRLTLSSPTSFVLKAGWGYLFEGALWMLDSPGEWHYDSTTGYLYAWMPDGSPPGNRVAVSRVDAGIDLAGKSNIVVDGLAMRNIRLGVGMRGSAKVTLRNTTVADTIDQGADVAGSTNSSLTGNSFARTGRDAIFGIDIVTGHMATGLQVVGNRIVDSGVRVSNGQIVSLPVKSFGAILSGNNALVSGNTIINTGYNGILPGSNSRVENNYIENASMVLDDGGAIYLGGTNNNSIVSNNVVFHVPGAVEGKPTNNSRGQGIYIDELGSGVTLSGNTVIDAEYGFHVHNGANNVIQNNKLYGNRRYQLWLEEDSKVIFPSGDVRGNRVSGNTMVPSSVGASVYHRSNFTTADQFSTYDSNIYSTLLSPLVAAEETANGNSYLTLAQWQAAKTAGGLPRNLDALARQAPAVTGAHYRVNGASIVPNGKFALGLAGWVSWNDTAPLGVQTLETCSVGPCLRYSAGATSGLVLSSYFSVVGGTWYRMAFDMKASVDGLPIFVGVQRSGGGSNGYEWLMSGISAINASPTWKRYVVYFQATKTVKAGDPLTLDLGARLDFVGVSPGKSLWLANIEIVPALPAGLPIRTNILMNSSHLTTTADCPDSGADAGAYCSSYVRITDGNPIIFPYTLAPLETQIIYSLGDILIDTDGDGIGDSQDLCPRTAAGAGVDSRGCAIGELAG